ncbi:hypothetical protein [Roseobacter fucihabitans]|uniref:hypothetical protein n=1 Tax=Roseobacter fucihabitans TaxID=1537242 RepID=UPI0016530B83|nr:hypothetical protein [Roseobacter litoralis]
MNDLANHVQSDQIQIGDMLAVMADETNPQHAAKPNTIGVGNIGMFSFLGCNDPNLCDGRLKIPILLIFGSVQNIRTGPNKKRG